MQTKHYVLMALAAGLIIGIGGWMIFFPKAASAPQNGGTSSTASTTTIDLGNGASIETTGGNATVEIIGSSAVPPSVAPLVISATLDDDAKVALQTQFKTLSAELKSAPTRTDLWLKLGVIYKIAGQYDGAVTAWTYVATAGAKTVNYVAYGNLGDLYLNFTHDYAKAAASYQAALKLQPNNADYQAGLKAAQAAQTN